MEIESLLAMRHIEYNDILINLLLKQRKNNTMPKLLNSGWDSYIPGENSIYETYGPKVEVSSKFSDTVMDIINFDVAKMIQEETSVTIGGVKYFIKDIPPIDCDRCLEIKAVDNKIIFESGKYYKYKDRDGNYRALTCQYNDVGQPFSEQIAKKVYKESDEMGHFWSVLGCEGVYGTMYYSNEEQKKILNDAGIKEGFFSVQVGSRKQELFYSNGVAGVAVPKSRYDGTYNMFMDGKVLEEYAVGSVFIIGGKEYILNADKKLDIPYGVDIYDIKYPPREVKCK
ncbi:MAG: hypothetical protein K2M91_09285 [Lachnospiraceae bacterium]|nr:hypothetical protein [Lachnospiraceae bacterium]